MVILYCNYNIELVGYNITKDTVCLVFGDIFNKSVDMLPTSIISLRFGHNFNQSVDMLPTSIKYLYFEHNFNQSVDMILSSIMHLHFVQILHVSNKTHYMYKNYEDACNVLTKNYF